MNAVSETQGARSASRTGMAATMPGAAQHVSRHDMRAVTVPAPSSPDGDDRAAHRSASQTALPAAADKTSNTAMPAQRPSPEAGRPYRSKPSTRAPAAESGADSRQAMPAPVLDATQEALREAAARASRQGRRGPTAIAPRVAREPEAKPVEAQPTDPSTRGEYAKAHLNELIQRRRHTRQASTELYPGGKRDTARELRQAQDMLRDQHYARAEDILRGLSEFEPGNELFRTLRLWAKFRAQPEQDDAQISELVDLAKKLIQTPEHGPFACYMLGHLYMAGKKDELAEKYFRRAHTADKTNKDAERHLLILERRKQQAAEAESASNRKIFGIAISSNKQKP
jgi:tetratricopeptide (TPR) repeat protein